MRGDAISGLLLAAAGIYAAAKSWGYGLGMLSQPGAGFFPFWAAVLVTACGGAIGALGLRGLRREPAAAASAAPFNWAKVAQCVVALLAYTAALPWIGFAVSTFLVMLGLSRLDPQTTWRGSIAIGALGAAGFWLLFVYALKVSFPPPVVGF